MPHYFLHHSNELVLWFNVWCINISRGK